MIYLASPYSHPDPAIREERFQAVCRASAALMRRGHSTFSPIAHSHPIAAYGVPTDWEFWQEFDRQMLERCRRLAVLMLPGWRESRGVQAEIDTAAALYIPTTYLIPDQEDAWPRSLTW